MKITNNVRGFAAQNLGSYLAATAPVANAEPAMDEMSRAYNEGGRELGTIATLHGFALPQGDITMAKNTGEDHRIGSVDDRTQVHNPKTGIWTKRDRSGGESAGQFMDGKADGTRFKGVAKEPDGRRS